MNITLSARGLDVLHRAASVAPDLVERVLLAEMTVVTRHIEGEVKEAWPVAVFNSREQITSDAFSSPAGVLGVVGTPSPYAPVIEDGRKPGKGVSKAGQEALALWAVGKLGVTPKKARSVAFLVSRKIKARGIAAKHPFAKTLARNDAYLVQAFEAAAERLAAQLGDALGGEA